MHANEISAIKTLFDVVMFAGLTPQGEIISIQTSDPDFESMPDGL